MMSSLKNQRNRKYFCQTLAAITRDKLPDNEGVEEAQYELTYDSKEYIAKFKRISLKEMEENSAMIVI